MVDETDEESVNLVVGEARLEAGKELTKYFITEDPKLVNDGNNAHLNKQA